ncbi:MAG: ABC transporter substrate-binding protein [bacterium]
MNKRNLQLVGIIVVIGLAIGAYVMLSPKGSTPTGTSKNDAPYVIGAVFDVTGTGAPLGTPEQDTAKMLEKQLNSKGGINGHKVKLIVLDNGSEEAKSVTAMKKLIEEDKVVAIIGSSQTGTTLAAASVVTAAKIPLVSCAAGVNIVKPVQPYIFKTAQSDVHAVAKVIDYLKAQDLKEIAVISVSNPFGKSGLDQLKLQTLEAGIKIVADESFQPTDTDMTAQLMSIRRTSAKAVICWGTNPGPALVAKDMATLKIKLPLIMSHGIANKKFIELAGPAAEGVVFPAGKLLIASELPDTDPQKAVLLAYSAAFKKEYSRDADTFGGHAYDAFNIVCDALKKVGPDPVKLRAEIESTKGYVGISGVFNFSAEDHNGLAKDAFAMVTIKDGKWVSVK